MLAVHEPAFRFVLARSGLLFAAPRHVSVSAAAGLDGFCLAGLGLLLLGHCVGLGARCAGELVADLMGV